jgi:benzoylformate decarboxylase
MIEEPYLGNREATTMPKPWVKWSYEPYPQDVPEAFMRAYAMALQPFAGPVFLSIPLDDWNQPPAEPARVRTVSNRFAPHPERLRLFADRISASRRPALVFGPDVDRSGGWDAAVAELLQITASPEVAAAARVDDALLGDAKIAIEELLELAAEGSARTAPEPMAAASCRSCTW